LLSIDVENDLAAVKHNRPVTEVERLRHRTGNGLWLPMQEGLL
jgi:hypothetical protein